MHGLAPPSSPSAHPCFSSSLSLPLYWLLLPLYNSSLNRTYRQTHAFKALYVLRMQMQHKGVSWSAKGPVANQGNETLWECARRRTRLLAPDCLFLCSMWMEPSMTAKQLTTVHSFLQLEPSDCWNIWLFVFHPQRPLMCAASSCVSVGCEPIRSQLDFLIIWPSTAKHCSLWCEWHVHFMISRW